MKDKKVSKNTKGSIGTYKKPLIIASVAAVISAACAITVTILFVNGQKQGFKDVDNAVTQAYDYVQQRELPDGAFGNVLQSKLEKSLVYCLGENEHLIIYGEESFTYDGLTVTKTDLTYPLYDDIDQCIELADIGDIVLTKGYYSAYDGGNGVYEVCRYTEDENFTTISDEDARITLKLLNYNSTVNIFQTGYKQGAINNFIKEFTSNSDYSTAFIPKGEYLITDNFDLNASNKNYLGYDCTLYADDNYSPYGTNNDCAFYIYGNIQSVCIDGFNVEVSVRNKLSDPLVSMLTVKDAADVIISNCSFYLPKQANVYDTSGMVDLLTGWSNVTVRDCKFENYSSTVDGGGITVRDTLKKECQNATFKNNYIYSNCKGEVIAICSGIDTNLYNDISDSGSVKNVTFTQNTIIGDKPNDDVGAREVGMRIGYQISPVKDIKFIDNDITMSSANQLLIYGKASNLTLTENDVKIDSSHQDGKYYTLFGHDASARAAYDIVVEDNKFSTLDGSNINTIATTEDEFSFIGNTFDTQNSVTRLFDCHSLFKDNVFNIKKINGCIYRDVKKVISNVINVDELNAVYEFYNLSLTSSVLIDSDQINSKIIASNFMIFNGTQIKFNDRAITFSNFKFTTEAVGGVNYYLANGTSSVLDDGVINFVNSSLSVYDTPSHNTVENDPQNKITINFSAE